MPLEPTRGLQIHEFGCNTHLSWHKVLDNGMKRKRRRGDKLKGQTATLSQSLMPASIDSVLHIDLRYTNGIAVRTAKAE